MDGNIAATYTLIHRFLKQQSQYRAAEAVKKAAKNIIALEDDVEHKGPPLEEIIKEWTTRQCPAHSKDADADASSKGSESSDSVSSSDLEVSSDSDSSSADASSSESEDDDESGKGTETTQSPRKGVERDTSVTLSSAGENTRIEPTLVLGEEKRSKKKNKGSSSESDSSDSNSSDSDSSDSDSSQENAAAGSSDDSEESTSSDDSDSDDGNETVKVFPDTANKSLNSSKSISDESRLEASRAEDGPVAKKRKISKNGVAATTAMAAESQQTARSLHKKGNPPTKVAERFQRVKVQNFTSDQLLDNGYKARGGKTNDYGQRAHRDLIETRGAGFRKEKNKKKRGSYRGGEITMENHSIRFDF